MSRVRLGVVAVLAVTLSLSLTGCFGPGEEEVIAQAQADFDALVEEASAVEITVLRTLEVEDPVSEPCDPDTDATHTVFVAAGTMAIQAGRHDERELAQLIEPDDDAEGERWTEIGGLPLAQRAYVGDEGVTASVKADDGLLVITVFSPCR